MAHILCTNYFSVTRSTSTRISCISRTTYLRKVQLEYIERSTEYNEHTGEYNEVLSEYRELSRDYNHIPCVHFLASCDYT